MKEINWTTASGANIEVTVSTDYRLDLQGNRKTSGERQVIIRATINGVEQDCHRGIMPVSNHPVVIAALGKIGLTAETLPPVQAAVDAAKAEIAAHNAAIDAHAAKLDSLGNGDINTMFGAHA